MSLRDQFVNSTLGHETVAVPLQANGKSTEVKVEVRGITVAQQYDLLERCRRPDGSINERLMAVETILATVYDPDTGTQVFDPADRDRILTLAARPFQVLLAAANRAAGQVSTEEAMADLDETQPDATSTS